MFCAFGDDDVVPIEEDRGCTIIDCTSNSDCLDQGADWYCADTPGCRNKCHEPDGPDPHEQCTESCEWVSAENGVDQVEECTNSNCDITYLRYRCGKNRYSKAGKKTAFQISALDCTNCAGGGTAPAGSSSASACTTNLSSCIDQGTTCEWVSGSLVQSGYENYKCTTKYTNCDDKISVTKYRCAANYYPTKNTTTGEATTQSDLDCKRCPTIDGASSTSSAGSINITGCCLGTGVGGDDGTGVFVITSSCCASK